jgi:hypothetical protein
MRAGNLVAGDLETEWRVEYEDWYSLIKTIRTRQIRFMGPIYRKGGIEQLSMTGKIKGRRSRGQ